LPDASSKINTLRGLKYSMNIQYIDKKNEEAKDSGVEHIGGR
jgi:hypothetical protein